MVKSKETKAHFVEDDTNARMNKPLSERITKKGNIKAEFVKEAVKNLKNEFKYETYWQKLCFKIDKIFGEFK